MRAAAFRVSIAGLAIGLSAPGALAQWSNNPATNLRIADRSGDQVQPKVQPTADGGCYVSWFDNSTGGYDVYLQRLDVHGVEQWPHNGILLADRAVSSTVDYDLTVDNLGNAVVTYNDDGGVSGATQQIAVQKVDPTGAKLWGPSGVTISSGPDFKANPHAAVLTDGSVVVGYSNGPSSGAQVWIMQRLDANGVPQWTAPGVSVSEASHYLALSDLKSDGQGGFIALWVRGSGSNPITSSKALYSQRYNNAGTPQWNSGSPVIVFNTTSIQNGYFPTCLSDGAGGAVYGWYEIGGSRNAYIQHVLANGTFKFASPVANTGPTAPATRIRVGAGLGYNVGTGEYYLASPETDGSTQSQNSTFVQKFDSSGNRLWSDTGATIIPASSVAQQSFVQCQPVGDGCMVFFMDTRSAVTRVIDSARVNGDASIPWHNLVNNDSSTDKSRLTSCMSTAGFAIVAYGWGATGSTDIAVQNINGDGTLGTPPTCYANCDASTTPPVLNVLDFSCFLNRFAAADTYANCDGSTTAPVLNVLDFACFLNRFAAGCP